ncbi:MAG: peptidylprolyl isomerase [Bacteroidales bacterium]
MKRLSIFCLTLIVLFSSAIILFTSCKAKDNRTHFMLETNMGNIEFALYNETPLHRDNYIKLIREGFFDGVLFHRVINDFMIQSGDPDSKDAKPGEFLGEGGPDYLINSEFRLPKIYHRRGVLGAAREGNDINPEMKSCASQFYIVTGKVFDDKMIKKVQERLNKVVNPVTLTPEMIEAYKTVGGTPHLDGQYTIFGEVVRGMNVVDKIQKVKTDENDRPLKDVRIIRAYIIE